MIGMSSRELALCPGRAPAVASPGMTTSPLLTPVTTAQLPTPVGPYSPGVIVGNLVFVSGQAGRDPQTGQLADDVEAQTEQTLRNVAAILEAAGSSLSQVDSLRRLPRRHDRVPEDERRLRPDVRRPPPRAHDGRGLGPAGRRPAGGDRCGGGGWIEVICEASTEGYGENGLNTKHRSERRRNEENRAIAGGCQARRHAVARARAARPVAGRRYFAPPPLRLRSSLLLRVEPVASVTTPSNSVQSSMREVALVTGASGGIGEDLARLIAAGGRDLVLLARSAREAAGARRRTFPCAQHHGDGAVAGPVRARRGRRRRAHAGRATGRRSTCWSTTPASAPSASSRARIRRSSCACSS